jgi:hypothetical protein
MKLVGNLHMMRLFHLFACDMLVATKTIVIDSLVGKKMAGEQLPLLRMTIDTGNPFGVNLRGRPHGNAALPRMAGKTD